MKLHTIMNWMRGVIQRDEPYDLPEDVYNDIMPSGVHEFPRSKFQGAGLLSPAAWKECSGEQCGPNAEPPAGNRRLSVFAQAKWQESCRLALFFFLKTGML